MPDDNDPGGVLGGLRDRIGEVGTGVYTLVLCFAVLVAVGLVGILREEPWVFPSLGPTVMLFFESPRQPTASAKNALVGHGVAIAIGALCLHGFGFATHPAAIVEGLVTRRVIAAAASVALTAFALRLLRSPHPPAGATTLIISLGVIKKAGSLAVMGGAVVLVTLLAVAINNLLGVRHPLLPVKPSSAA